MKFSNHKMTEKLTLRWLGINGFELQYRGTTVLIDPCVTRGDSDRLSDPALVQKYLRRADAIVITHSHWDHLADVPEIIRRTGAALYGTPTTCNIARYYGIAENLLHEVGYQSHISLTPEIIVDFLESRHLQPCNHEGSYHTVPACLAARSDFLCGEVLALRFQFGHTVVLNVGSANLAPEAIRGTRCDYLLCGISRWKPGFPELLADNLDFNVFIPTHHDDFVHFPLSRFALRDDFIRLRPELAKLRPETRFLEVNVLQDYELECP